MEESQLAAPMMNEMFDPQYISQSSTSSMLIPQISILQPMSSNLPSMVQIPMSQILSQPQNSLLSTPSVAPSTVDGPIGVIDQGGIDVGSSVPMPSTLALDVKPDEMALKEEGKAVTFHLCQMEEGRSGQEGVQMDDKRVKGMYVQCCFVCWIPVWEKAIMMVRIIVDKEERNWLGIESIIGELGSLSRWLLLNNEKYILDFYFTMKERKKRDCGKQGLLLYLLFSYESYQVCSYQIQSFYILFVLPMNKNHSSSITCIVTELNRF